MCLMAAVPVAAQQRPLVTEDPEVVGAGMVLLEGGFDYARDVLYPASGLQGNLMRVPTIGLSFGLFRLIGFHQMNVKMQRARMLWILRDSFFR